MSTRPPLSWRSSPGVATRCAGTPGRRFAEVVAKSGARFCAMPDALDWDYNDLDAAFPGRAELKGLKQNQFDIDRDLRATPPRPPTRSEGAPRR